MLGIFFLIWKVKYNLYTLNFNVIELFAQVTYKKTGKKRSELHKTDVESTSPAYSSYVGFGIACSKKLKQAKEWE